MLGGLNETFTRCFRNRLLGYDQLLYLARRCLITVFQYDPAFPGFDLSPFRSVGNNGSIFFGMTKFRMRKAIGKLPIIGH